MTWKRGQHGAGWRSVRRGVQLVALGLFVWSLMRLEFPTPTLPGAVPPAPFLRFDPLAAITGAFAASADGAWRTALACLLFAVPVVLLTALMGRIWCGWVCPLGTCLDLSDRVLARRARMRHLRWPKYVILLAALISVALGTQLLFLVEPIALLTRALTAGHLLAHGVITPGALLAIIGLALVLGLSVLGRRCWCRTLCPLGALLALVSRISPFGRRVANRCRGCTRCVRVCPMAATENGRSQLRSECLACGECAAVCPETAVAFGVSSRQTDPSPADPDRRRFLVSTGAGVLCIGTLHAATVIAERTQHQHTAIRPPGALPESAFLTRCIRCGACVKACPTGGVQLVTVEAGPNGMLSPALRPRLGECTPRCNACAQVCPTGALQPFTAKEKPGIVIGLAMIDQHACTAHTGSRPCTVCIDCCPYAAIAQQDVNGRPAPLVDHSRCVGCGLCENRCPLHPKAAIRVERTESRQRNTIYPRPV